MIGLKRHVPLVLQMEAVECGAASLAMVLRYFGRWDSLLSVRQACGVSREGSTASSILQAAKRFGLRARGQRLSLEDLEKLDTPCILHWNMDHFVVFEGVKKTRHGTKYKISDPEAGRRLVGQQEFNSAFTGIVLRFRPGETFKKEGKPPSLLRMLASWMDGLWRGIAIITFIGFLVALPGLVIPILGSVYIDRVLIADMQGFAGPLLLGLAFATLARIFLTRLQNFLLTRFEVILAVKATTRLYTHILDLPISFFAQRHEGELVNRIELCDRVANIVATRLFGSIIALAMLVIFLLAMLQMSVVLTMCVLLVTALNLVSFSVFADTLKTISQRVLIEDSKLFAYVTSSIQMIETLKSTGAEQGSFRKLSGHHAEATNVEQELHKSSLLSASFPVLLSTLTSGVVLVAGGYLVMQGQLTIGLLIGFHALSSSFQAPVIRLIELGETIQFAQAELERLRDVMLHPKDVEARPVEASDAPRLNGNIELENVTFGFNPVAEPLLKDVSLKIPAGSSVALVGASGSGKSTVAKLIVGLVSPWEGSVLIDGKDRRDHPRNVLTRDIGYVQQAINLFEGTIRENISLWDRTIPEEALLDAAADALIEDDIAMRPHAFEHELLENGKNLSGGQRQRLEISRVLAKEPTILVMDEATSALDAMTEEQLEARLAARNLTRVVIAHRLSTVRDCDLIVVMDQGQIVEQGTHNELSALANGTYRRLLEAA